MPGSPNKTVYVLGAGFSAAARLPMQREILSGLLDEISYSFSGIVPSDSERQFQKQLKRHIGEVSSFIRKCFPTSDQPLEDVFTLLDQTIQSKGHFSGYDHLDLIHIRESWISLISGFYHAHLAGYLNSSSDVYQRFAAYLLDSRMRNGVASDPLSVISLNWDSLLEDSLYQIFEVTKGIRKADVDHCVYTTPLDDSPHTPSPKQKAGRLFNIKILKIHGSISWLRCPNSNHLYTGLGSKANAYDTYIRARKSPFIASCYPDADASKPPQLEPFIITPTYAKVFDQPHIQTTWHNAYVELREATKVIFVGYSLPEADYHFRTLLRRAIRKKTAIQVVLYTDDERPSRDELDSSAPNLQKNATFAMDRYERLFGGCAGLDFNFEGVESLVDRLMPAEDYPSCLDRIREHFSRHRTAADLVENFSSKAD